MMPIVCKCVMDCNPTPRVGTGSFPQLATIRIFFVVDITFDNRQSNVFQRVIVFDSLSSTARRRATAVLHQVQKFLSGFCFYKLGHHQSLLKDPDYIMQVAEFRQCPMQTNGYDCGLFALAVVWHLLCDKDIHPSVFTQAPIDTVRVALRHGLSSNPE
ncbi:Ulp1 protease family protein [Nitzschia inconspicua]|uniref:Ulp1 protease family protein n=1 Tax=Nitzschia inconspicua TaxID=303405 RepID=A0A9K3L9T4_9STRA|nr:Ulp1 protease family protein [Nitzschia inconspicua]